MSNWRKLASHARVRWVLVPTACLAPILITAIAKAQGDNATILSTVQKLRAHDFVKALSLSTSLTRTRPRDPRTWTLKGMAYAGLRQNEQALKAFNHALAMNPHYVVALKAAAQMEYDSGSPEAEKLLERLAREDPQDQTAHAMLGALAYKRRDCSAAIGQFGKSPDVIADSPVALAEFGGCLLSANRPQDAIPVFQRLERLRPSDWRWRYAVGLSQFLCHHYTEAIESIKSFAQEASTKPEVLNLLAAVYEANEQTPKAVAVLQRAIKLVPHDANNYLDLATICLDHGAFQVGVNVLNAALKIIPRSAALHIARGVLYVQMAHYKEANTDFDRANALEPSQNLGALARGISLVEENDLGEALETVRKRLKQAPDEPGLNYLLAEVLIRKGIRPGTPEFQEAKKAAQRAVRSKPDFALAYDELGLLYLKAGQIDKSIAASRLAVKADPADSDAIYHLIICMRKEGNKRELQELVKKLAEMSAAARKRTAAINRFKLVEANAKSASRNHSN
jgi:tetratricopeptide (TPR) repeat protein